MGKGIARLRACFGRAAHRALIFPLFCGVLLTFLLYLAGWGLRKVARGQVAEGAASTMALRLDATLKTLEEKLTALRVLWSASRQVDSEEWSLAWRLLRAGDLTEWLAAGVAQCSRDRPALPCSCADCQKSPRCSFLHVSVAGQPGLTQQEVSNLVDEVWARGPEGPESTRFTATSDRYLVLGMQALRPFDGRQRPGAPTWVWGVIDVEKMLSRLLREGPLGGRVSLLWRGEGHSWVVSAASDGRSPGEGHQKGFVKPLPWNGGLFAVEFVPTQVRAGTFYEWLPWGGLGLGGMLTGALLIAGSLCGRLQKRFFVTWQRLSALLHESDKRYQAVFANIRQPLLIVGADREILENNPAAESFFGGNLVGQRFCKLCARAAAGRGECSDCCWFDGKERGGGDSWEKEGRVLGADGQPREVVARISRVRLGEDVKYSVVAFQDVTQERAVQRRLEKSATDLEAANVRLRAYSEEIENAARAKITLLASMSHEIRTPLGAIIGYARLLGEELGPLLKGGGAAASPQPTAGPDETAAATENRHKGRSSSDIVEEALHGLIRNSEHLQEMINTVLDFSKLESGEMRVERIAVNPVAIVDDVLRMLAGKARQKGLKLGLETRGPIPEVIHSDPTRLRQILLNLTDNAIKFTPQGRVWIEMELDRATASGPVLEFRVCDTGVGMSPDQIGRLFQAFRQADVSTYRQFGGTGLGLMISRKLARLLGGDIWVESTPGKGTIFHVRIATGPLENLPTGEAAADGQRGAAPATEASSREKAGCEEGEERAVARHGHPRGRVLVAEDCADNRRLIRHYLEKAGLSVELAENGRQAVEKYHRALERQKPFDLILMDVEMPELDGVAAVRRLRDGGCTIPILAMTAHTDPGCVQQFLAAGFSGYLPKPLYREQLWEALGEFLVKRYPGSQAGPSTLTSGWKFFAHDGKTVRGSVARPEQEPVEKGSAFRPPPREGPEPVCDACPG